MFGQINLIQNEIKDSYMGRESKLIDKLKNIDGKVITSNHSF